MRANELPARPSRSVLTIGMAPPTAASKLSATPLLLGERGERRRRAARAAPCWR